jgi:hypothetical protein
MESSFFLQQPHPPMATSPMKYRSILRLLPLLGPVMVGLALFYLLAPGQPQSTKSTPTPEPPHQSPTTTPPATLSWQPISITPSPPNGTLEGWMQEQGAFTIKPAPNGSGMILEQNPEPMTEGIYRSWARFTHGGLRARMWGESHRRVPPRFSIGLEGKKPFHLRVATAHQRLELVTPPEIILQQLPWSWEKERAVWLEITCSPGPENSTLIEARVWHEGDPRPEDASLQHREPGSIARLSPSIRGGPFALKPIHTDHISLLKPDSL